MNALERRKFTFLFRVVSLGGKTQSLKPVVRIHTRSCLLEQSPFWRCVQALARILRSLLTAVRGYLRHEACAETACLTDFVGHSVSPTCTETTDRSPMDSGEEGTWDFLYSSFWSASTSPKSLSLPMGEIRYRGRLNGSWGMWRGSWSIGLLPVVWVQYFNSMKLSHTAADNNRNALRLQSPASQLICTA